MCWCETISQEHGGKSFSRVPVCPDYLPELLQQRGPEVLKPLLLALPPSEETEPRCQSWE